MTSTKYFLLRLASRFGYLRKNIRLSDAANEAHLLKEAETFLGEAVWRKTENIEALSMEYWNLRKLVKDHDRVSKEIAQLQGVFNETHQQKTDSIISASDAHPDLSENRIELLAQIDTLSRERNQIVTKTQDTRRIYEGLKFKQDVLRKEGAKLTEIEKTSSRLAEMKREFNELKERLEEVSEEVATAKTRLLEIEALTNERKQYGKSQATESSQSISDANQQISARQTQINSLYPQIRLLYGDIGRHVSMNAPTDPACKAAGKDQSGLIHVITALRKSIRYNWKLAERR